MIPEGTLGTLRPLRYKGGGTVCIACMYDGCLGVLGWAGSAVLFFPFKIMGNSSCYMFSAVRPSFRNGLGMDNKG